MSQQKAAGATGMELSILKLGSPRRRFASGQFSFDFDAGYLNTSNPGTPSATAPASPRALSRSADEDYEMVFEQHQAAIPFIWEEKPGTPRGASARITIAKEEGGSSGSEDEESDAMTRSNPSSRTSSTRESEESSPPTSEFEFASSETIDIQPNHSKPADELFAKGQILPLKPPPRLQSIKQLMAADAAEDAMGYYSPNRTPGHSFRKDGLRTPTRSFRKDGLKAFISSPRREKPAEQQVTTMLGFEEWPKGENRNHGSGHRRTSSLSKLPALFRKKSGLGKENIDDYFESEGNFDGDSSWRKNGLEGGGDKRRPLVCLSSRMLDGSYGKDDVFGSSRNTFDVDARSDYFNTSGRTIHEEEPELDGEEQVQALDSPRKKQGKLSRFFTKKPSRLSAVAPSPQSPEDLKIKRVPHSSPLLRMCLSNCIGQALVRGVKHFRSLDPHPRRAISAGR